jgi:trehalose 6-phosphate phosphatase
LEVQIDPRAGIVLEDKGATLAVHYRNARRPLVARRAILKAVSNLSGARIVAGKMVVDLLPQGPAHKGAALTILRRREGCRSAIYVGDDQTDEDAFALGNSVLGIRVGRRKGSLAQYYLRRQDEIDGLLAALIAARTDDRRSDQGHKGHKDDKDDKRLLSSSVRPSLVARRPR